MDIIKNHPKRQGALCASKYQSMYDRHGTPISFDELMDLVVNPIRCGKGEAPLIILANCEGKTKDIIKLHNKMTWLWVDLDSGNKTLSEVIDICKTYKITKAVIYSTASACREKKGVMQGFRWRVVILPSQSLGCENWKVIQLSLARIFGGGIEATKISQGFYAPSCCDGGFYEYSII